MDVVDSLVWVFYIYCFVINFFYKKRFYIWLEGQLKYTIIIFRTIKFQPRCYQLFISKYKELKKKKLNKTTWIIWSNKFVPLTTKGLYHKVSFIVAIICFRIIRWYCFSKFTRNDQNQSQMRTIFHILMWHFSVKEICVLKINGLTGMRWNFPHCLPCYWP